MYLVTFLLLKATVEWKKKMKEKAQTAEAWPIQGTTTHPRAERVMLYTEGFQTCCASVTGTGLFLLPRGRVLSPLYHFSSDRWKQKAPSRPDGGLYITRDSCLCIGGINWPTHSPGRNLEWEGQTTAKEKSGLGEQYCCLANWSHLLSRYRAKPYFPALS